MRWVGTRSYSIYLWHWPIFSLSRPGLDLPFAPEAALALRLVLTVAAAEMSYRFVEMPIRRRGLRSVLDWPGPGERPHRPRPWGNPALAGGLAAAMSVVLVSAAMATPPPPPDGLQLASINAVVVDLESAPAAESPESTDDPTVDPSPEPSPATTPTPDPTLTPKSTILAFGESVMIQGAEALAKDLGPVRVDAAVGRHINEGIEILQRRAATGSLADTVIVQLGNNGPFRAGQFDAVMNALVGVPRVVWVNVRVPRDWEAHNNRVIASGISHYPNARLVDWYTATEGRTDLFWKDGYHPRPKGAKLYADLIAAEVR